MPKNADKRCPQCGGSIDYFGSCRRCGREWSEELEEEELAEGLPEGQQHPSEVKPPKKQTRTRTRYTKNSRRASADKYALWRVDAKSDDETEIIRKRSLMRLDSRKTYNQMGLALRAHDASKAAVLWLSRLWELLSEDEQRAIAPAIDHIRRGYADLKLVAQSKVNEAAKMEVELEREHKAARAARAKLMEKRNRERLKEATKQIVPGEDTEGMSVPEPASLDPQALGQLSYEDLLELAKHKLADIDAEKALRRRAERITDEDDPGE
jgi:hypothetical protein